MNLYPHVLGINLIEFSRNPNITQWKIIQYIPTYDKSL